MCNFKILKKNKQMSKSKERKQLEELIGTLEPKLESLRSNGAPDVSINAIESLVEGYKKQLASITPSKKRTKSPRKQKYNARKAIYRGDVYDSTREALMARELDRYGIKYDRQVTFDLIPEVEIAGKKLRKRSLKADFTIDPLEYGLDSGIIIDVKGLQTELSKFKYALLKSQLLDSYSYEFPSTDKEVKELAHKVASLLGQDSNALDDDSLPEIEKMKPSEEDLTEVENESIEKSATSENDPDDSLGYVENNVSDAENDSFYDELGFEAGDQEG